MSKAFVGNNFDLLDIGAWVEIYDWDGDVDEGPVAGAISNCDCFFTFFKIMIGMMIRRDLLQVGGWVSTRLTVHVQPRLFSVQSTHTASTVQTPVALYLCEL